MPGKRKLGNWKNYPTMLNSQIALNITRFILLLLAQVLLFSKLNLLGYLNPMVYVLFFYWYPLRVNRSLFMVVSFLLGFLIDIFLDTMAINAFASLTVAYLRPLLLRVIYGNNHDFQTFNYGNTTLLQRISFLTALVLIHHSIFFTIEILSFSHFGLILRKVVLNGVLTIFICVLLNTVLARES